MVAACIKNGCHYVDINGETPYVRHVVDKYAISQRIYWNPHTELRISFSNFSLSGVMKVRVGCHCERDGARHELVRASPWAH